MERVMAEWRLVKWDMNSKKDKKMDHYRLELQ